MIKNNLLKTVSMPYQTVRGSFEVRQQRAEQFTRKAMKEISGVISKEDISLSKFGRIVKKIFPKNLKIFVKKDKGTDSYARVNRIFTKDNYIVNQSLDMTPNENGKITSLEIPFICHEIRHMSDYMYHPKILSREQLIAKKGLDTKKFLNFYDTDVYVEEMEGGKKLRKAILNDIRNHTTKALKGYSAEDKINMLQYIRYNLITERNAYKDEHKMAKKIHKKKQPVYNELLQDQTKEYMFDEKIKLFHDMIAELIKKERGIHRAKLKNQN